MILGCDVWTDSFEYDFSYKKQKKKEQKKITTTLSWKLYYVKVVSLFENKSLYSITFALKI